MIRGTTPKLIFTFKKVVPSDITVAYMTLVQSGLTIEKDLAEAEVGEDSLTWSLTQAETISLRDGEVKLQIRYKTSDMKIWASKIYTTSVYDILKEDEI